MKGIDRRSGANGDTRWRARVRVAGRTFARTFSSERAAQAWRLEALDRVEEGRPLPEPPPRQQASAAPLLLVDAARRFCHGAVAGSIRASCGLPYKRSTIEKYEA